jgi:hypothetical protein
MREAGRSDALEAGRWGWEREEEGRCWDELEEGRREVLDLGLWDALEAGRCDGCIFVRITLFTCTLRPDSCTGYRVPIIQLVWPDIRFYGPLYCWSTRVDVPVN